MYKFRSMFIEKRISKRLIQAKFNDERITKVGRFIRKYCIDELPQLINVIKGEMSLVGPRPHAIEHNEYYRKLITGYMQRHSKLPGMTGLAQTSGARGETSDIELMKKRIKFDIEYSGLNFLCSKELLKDFKSTEIHYSEKFNYLENFEDVYKLFRSIKNVGAQSTNCKRKTVKELKKIQKFWPKNYNNTVNLSWQIEIQIIKKL